MSQQEEESKFYESLNSVEQMAYRDLKSKGIVGDYSIIFSAFALAPKPEQVIPLITYREYIEKQNWNPDLKQFALQNTDVQKVNQLDQLVQEANADLDNLKKNSDLRDEYHNRAWKIIRGE